jgi:hypothetical protein
MKRAPMIEWGLMLAVVASTGWTAWRFAQDGYLPQPFVFDTKDTFMDWFNTAYWAQRPGAWQVWGSIYPPLSFVFLRLVSLPDCYVGSPFAARDCDSLGRAAIVLCYLADIAVAALAFRRTDPATAIPRTVAFALGLPLLFTLERGNLILPCFLAFAVAHAPVCRNRAARALAAGLTINFKPYLILPVLARVLTREWRALEWAAAATVAIYLVTLALAGGGTIDELVRNTTSWVSFVGGQVWNEVNYSTSYAPFLNLPRSGVPLLDFVPSRVVEGVQWAVPRLIRVTQGLALAALVPAWIVPGVLTRARIAALILGAYLVTQSPGGYTQVFLVFLVLLEPWQGTGARIALVSAYALLLTGDMVIAPILELQSNSWLSHAPVTPRFGLTLGHVLRPGLVVLIVWALALDAIGQVLWRLHVRSARIEAAA